VSRKKPPGRTRNIGGFAAAANVTHQHLASRSAVAISQPGKNQLS
jgi:hypothetical protein